VSGVAATLTPARLAEMQEALSRLRLDGWLLFDFHGLNPVAPRVLGLPPGLATRRLFVLIPAAGPPVAVAHRVELHRVAGFPGAVRPYAAWRELERELRAALAGRRVAMEYSPDDAVPYLDRVPAGVLELVRRAGAQVVSSAELVTAIAARWTAAELDGHRRAAERLRSIASAAFAVAQEWMRDGDARATEHGLQTWVREALAREALVTVEAPIVAVGPNSANPHHEPAPEPVAPIRPDQVLLLDLWGGVAPDAVFADQTWMAFTGTAVPDEVMRVFEVVRDARDQVVATLRDRWREGWSVTGADLDDVAREAIRAAGYGEHFLHRTGHSIDRDLHGSGPHLDNFETRDQRVLVAGVGFSVEPGVYLPGRFGVRSEINVVLHPDGPEVTPAAPQHELVRLAVGELT
jgi:Xaa-Pro aminopeptidase